MERESRAELMKKWSEREEKERGDEERKRGKGGGRIWLVPRGRLDQDATIFQQIQ